MPHHNPSDQDKIKKKAREALVMRPANVARLSSIGWDGMAMLALSVLWIAVTAGWAFFWALWTVIAVGKRAQTSAPEGAPLVVFGVCLAGSTTPNALYKQRLRRAMLLQPRATLVLGGNTHLASPCSEASAGREWLIAHGVAKAQLYIEDKSTNTLENLYGVRQFINEHGVSTPSLISNRFHLARCSLMASGIGIEHNLCAAEDNFNGTPSVLMNLFIEAFFINAYWVGRWFSSTFKHQGMLKRISPTRED